MPQIAEIKEIEGAMWVRIPWPAEEEGSISIFTEKEVDDLKRSVALDISNQVLLMYPKSSV